MKRKGTSPLLAGVANGSSPSQSDLEDQDASSNTVSQLFETTSSTRMQLQGTGSSYSFGNLLAARNASDVYTPTNASAARRISKFGRVGSFSPHNHNKKRATLSTPTNTIQVATRASNDDGKGTLSKFLTAQDAGPNNKSVSQIVSSNEQSEFFRRLSDAAKDETVEKNLVKKRSMIAAARSSSPTAAKSKKRNEPGRKQGKSVPTGLKTAASSFALLRQRAAIPDAPQYISVWQVAFNASHNVEWAALKTFAQSNLMLWHSEQNKSRTTVRGAREAEFNAVPYGSIGIVHDHTNTMLHRFITQLNTQFVNRKGSQWEVPIRYRTADGNLDVAVIKQRQEALNNPLLESAIRRLWAAFPKDHRGGLTQEVHQIIFTAIFDVLAFDLWDPRERQKLVERDWDGRAEGRPGIDSDIFFESTRMLCDAWCETTDAAEPIEFIEMLEVITIDAVTTHRDAIRKITETSKFHAGAEKLEAKNMILGSLGRRDVGLSAPAADGSPHDTQKVFATKSLVSFVSALTKGNIPHFESREPQTNARPPEIPSEIPSKLLVKPGPAQQDPHLRPAFAMAEKQAEFGASNDLVVNDFPMSFDREDSAATSTPSATHSSVALTGRSNHGAGGIIFDVPPPPPAYDNPTIEFEPPSTTKVDAVLAKSAEQVTSLNENDFIGGQLLSTSSAGGEVLETRKFSIARDRQSSSPEPRKMKRTPKPSDIPTGRSSPPPRDFDLNSSDSSDASSVSSAGSDIIEHFTFEGDEAADPEEMKRRQSELRSSTGGTSSSKAKPKPLLSVEAAHQQIEKNMMNLDIALDSPQASSPSGGQSPGAASTATMTAAVIDAVMTKYLPLEEIHAPIKMMQAFSNWRGSMHCSSNNLFPKFSPRCTGHESKVSVKVRRQFAMRQTLLPEEPKGGAVEIDCDGNLIKKTPPGSRSVTPAAQGAAHHLIASSGAQPVPHLPFEWFVLLDDNDLNSWMPLGVVISKRLTTMWYEDESSAPVYLKHDAGLGMHFGDVEPDWINPQTNQKIAGFDVHMKYFGIELVDVGQQPPSRSTSRPASRSGFQFGKIGGGGSSLDSSVSATPTHNNPKNRSHDDSYPPPPVNLRRICARYDYLWEYENTTKTSWIPFPDSIQAQLTDLVKQNLAEPQRVRSAGFNRSTSRREGSPVLILDEHYTTNSLRGSRHVSPRNVSMSKSHDGCGDDEDLLDVQSQCSLSTPSNSRRFLDINNAGGKKRGDTTNSPRLSPSSLSRRSSGAHQCGGGESKAGSEDSSTHQREHSQSKDDSSTTQQSRKKQRSKNFFGYTPTVSTLNSVNASPSGSMYLQRKVEREERERRRKTVMIQLKDVTLLGAKGIDHDIDIKDALMVCWFSSKSRQHAVRAATLFIDEDNSIAPARVPVPSFDALTNGHRRGNANSSVTTVVDGGMAADVGVLLDEPCIRESEPLMTLPTQPAIRHALGRLPLSLRIKAGIAASKEKKNAADILAAHHQEEQHHQQQLSDLSDTEQQNVEHTHGRLPIHNARRQTAAPTTTSHQEASSAVDPDIEPLPRIPSSFGGGTGGLKSKKDGQPTSVGDANATALVVKTAGPMELVASSTALVNLSREEIDAKKVTARYIVSVPIEEEIKPLSKRRIDLLAEKGAAILADTSGCPKIPVVNEAALRGRRIDTQRYGRTGGGVASKLRPSADDALRAAKRTAGRVAKANTTIRLEEELPPQVLEQRAQTPSTYCQRMSSVLKPEEAPPEHSPLGLHERAMASRASSRQQQRILEEGEPSLLEQSPTKKGRSGVLTLPRASGATPPLSSSSVRESSTTPLKLKSRTPEPSGGSFNVVQKVMSNRAITPDVGEMNRNLSYNTTSTGRNGLSVARRGLAMRSYLSAGTSNVAPSSVSVAAQSQMLSKQPVTVSSLMGGRVSTPAANLRMLDMVSDY